MNAKTFVDTNILIYAHDVEAQTKHQIAQGILRELWNRRAGALSTQVLQEFYVQATRPSEARVAPEVAVRFITSWTRFPVQQMTLDLMFAALAAHRRFGISYWDAAIIEAARSLGCSEVLTEDLQDHQSFRGLRAINPFL